MMSDILFTDFIVLAVATWRLAYLVTNDDITASFRNRMHFELWRCIYCFSVWSGAIVLLMWLIGLNGIVWILALAGGALLLHVYTGAMHV